MAAGRVGTTGNSWTASFGRAAQGMTLAQSSSRVSFVPAGASKSKPVVKPTKRRSANAKLASSSLVPPAGVVSWSGVWHDAALAATVRTDGVAYDVILDDSKASASYTFVVKGARLSAASNGGVDLIGVHGVMFTVAPPRVVTAHGVDVTAASRAFYSVDGNRLVVKLDKGWLASRPVGVFPVKVDPDVCSGLNCPATGSESFPNNGGASVGGIQVGTGSGVTWRAGVYFNQYEPYINSGYEVYDAQLQVQGFTCYCSASSASLKVWDQYPAKWPPSGYGQIGQSVSLVEGPWTGAMLEVGSDVQKWLSAGQTGGWFGLTSDGQALTSYTPYLFTLDLYRPPQPSRVVDLTEGQVLSTTSPTLQASQIPANPVDPTTRLPMFDYQITTGAAPGTGLVIDSGGLCDNDTGSTQYLSCKNSASDGSLPPMPTPPGWSVPPGILSEGVTYHAWVLTDWYGNSSAVPKTVPPASWGATFSIRLGLGSGGPSPTDSVGSVPGQSSTPSQGSPSPGLPGSKLTVNMVNGNASFSVGTPTLATLGGGLSLGFTYNSLAATSQGLNQGLTGVYYNDTNADDATTDNLGLGTDTEIGQRVDPNINFDWGSTPPMAAQNLGEADIRWSGTITFNASSTWALGDISSDGMQITLGAGGAYCPHDVCLSDWGPHAVQATPTFGPAFSASTTPIPITIDWHHSTSSPAVAELYVEDLSQSEPQPSLVPATWLNHSPTILSSGWTLNSNTAQASWVGLTDHGSSVTVYGPDGTGFEFVNAGGGTYTSPVQAPNTRLRVDTSGNFVLDDPGGGLIYTFAANGTLSSIRSASDDLHPAALSYSYTGSPPLLSTIADPVSGNSASLSYGASNCPAPPSGYSPAPPNMLCQIDFSKWNGTTVGLYYNSSGELAQLSDPGNVNWQFAYDSSGRLTQEMDPLAYQASQSGARTDCATGSACVTVISYDASGRAETVTQPAPVQGGAQPERGYCYGFQDASFSNGTLTCSSPSSNVTSLAVAGLSPSVGYVEQLRYDNRNRISSTRDSAGLVTSYVWDAQDHLLSSTSPSGVETSSAYDSQGRQISAYGPAPSSSFNPDGTPIAGQNVATASTTYDGGMSGFAGAWYANTTLTGTPSYHALAAPSESWSGSSSPSSGSSEPNLIPSSGFSGHLTGLATLPSPGRLSFDGDGGQLRVDGHPYVNQMGGPYPAQVRADGPGHWWRLGEATGAAEAADSAGTSIGTYLGGVALGQTSSGPLADNDSTYATFDGTTGTVSVADSSSLELNNTEAFSLEAWVRTSASGSQAIVSKMANAAPYQGWEFGLSNGKPYFYLINNWNSNAILAVANSAIDGNWHHLAVTYDGSSKAAGVKLYVDGQPVADTITNDNLTASSVSTAPLDIGSRAAGSEYFNGSMADIAIYPNTDLSASRVLAQYSAAAQTSALEQGPVIYNTAYPQAVDADTPVSYWRLDDASGATATDSNGPNNGTYSNVSLAQPGALVGDTSTSAGFNGSNSTVSVPDTSALQFSNSQSFSVEAWVKTTSGSTWQMIASKMANAAPYQGWEVGTDNGEPYFYLINSWSSNAILDVANTSIADGSWHHLAVTYNGSSRAAGVSFYIDGRPAAYTIDNDNLTATATSTAPLYIGSRAGSVGFFNGNISDVAVYNQTLSATKIYAHYQAGVLASYPQEVEGDQPVGFWRLAGGPPAVAAGTNPAVVSMGNGQIAVAYQAADTDQLWTWVGTPGTAGTASTTNQTMASGTSPAIDFIGNGQVAVAYQAAGNNELWTWDGTPGSTGDAGPTDLGIAAGTSPSIAAMNNGTGYVAVAFQAYGSGQLWTWDGPPATTGVAAGPTNLGLAPNTSPSIASMGNGDVSVAFQAAGTGYLWTWEGTPGSTGSAGGPTNLGLAPNTSPSVALMPNGQISVAFQAAGGTLWTWEGSPGSTGSAGGPANLGVAAGTSPSLVSMGTGNISVGFQAAGGALWTWEGNPGQTSNIGQSTNLDVAAGTSPGLVNLGSGQLSVAFQPAGASLWTWQGAPGAVGAGGSAVVSAANDSMGPDTGTDLGGVSIGQAGPLAGDPDTSTGFNGTTGTISIPDNPGLEFSNNQPFSVEAWVKTTATSGMIASKMANSSPYTGWELGLTSGEPHLLLINTWSSNAIDVNSTTSVADGNWHHLVLTYDGSSKAAGVTFYIDGNPTSNHISFDSLSASSSSTAPLYIGSRAASTGFFDGDLADIAVYPSALNAGQIALHHQVGLTAPGPSAHSTTHTVTVDDQQFVASGHLNVTSTAAGTTFDPNYGLVTQTTDADGKTTTTSYSDATHGIGPQFGLPTTVTQDPDGLDLTTTTTYETPGAETYLRVLAKTLPAGNGPTYTYYTNTAGPLAAVCGVSATTSQAGALEQKTDPAPGSGAGDALEEQYVYDSTGRQVGTRTGTVNTIGSAGWECTNYDAAGRVTSQSYPAVGSATPRTVTYSYSVNNNPFVDTVTDTNWGSATISSTVDLLDRVSSYSDIWANTTTTTYDQAGRITATSGPQGDLSYSYDPATGRPTTTILGSTTLASNSYDNYGRLTSVNVDGTTTGETIGYDTNGRQNSEALSTPGSADAGGAAETYSPAGRVATQQIYTNGALNPATNLSYDGAGRLTQDVEPGVTYNYSYTNTTSCTTNNAGADTNRTSSTVTIGNTNTTTGYCYDNADRLDSTSSIASGQIAYDTHGNMVQEGQENLAYDSSDQITLDETPSYLNLYKRDPLERPVQISNYTKITAGNTTTATVTAASAITIGAPTGTTPGDELVAAVTTTAQSGPGIPAGWAQIAGTQNGSDTTWVFAHQAVSGDPASWSFGVNATATNIVATMVDYHNPNSANPIDVSAAVNDASSTTQPLPQVNATGYAETVVHVVGYNLGVTPTAPSEDTTRAATTGTLVSQLVSDRYQQQPGTTAAASANSNLATASEAITVALAPAVSTSRLGYTGQTEASGITQNTAGAATGTTISLSGGVSYTTGPGGASWVYTNQHGDTIMVTDSSNNRTWYGYWGPYGETPPGQSTPPDTVIAGGSYGYNGAQAKLTQGNLILMGARPYLPADGRFTQPDPISGGCANAYTYAFGDPVNDPDLSGQGFGWHSITCFVSKHKVAIGIGLGALSVFTGGAGLAVDALVEGAGAATVGLGAGSVVTGAGAAYLDSKSCLEEGGSACVGIALGGGGALFGGGGLLFPAEVGEDTGVGALAAKLGAAGLGFGAGVGGLTYDTASALVVPQKKSHC